VSPLGSKRILDFCAYVRIYLREHKDIKSAEKELDKVLAECDYALDGLYDLSICLANVE